MSSDTRSSCSSAGPQIKLTHWVYILAALLIGLASAALLFVGLVSSREADRQALESERKLFENVLRERHNDISQQQLTVTQWDRSVAKISLGLDRTFVREEFLHSLWYDYEIERNILVAPDNTLVVSSVKQRLTFAARKLEDTDPLALVAARSRQTYFDNRIEIEGGFMQRPVPRSQSHRLGTYSFGMLDGRPVLMSAMAIVPGDGEVALDEGAPVILISARSIDQAFIADLNAHLSFPDLRFEQTVPDNPQATDWLVRDSAGSVIGVFKWNGQKPGARIFRAIIPVVVAMALVLAAAAFFLSRKIGKLSTALEDNERRNRHFALHDPLTALPNRRHFTDHLAYAIDQLPAQPFALMCCDLDRFKAVNDTYGHSAGDTVIRAVADLLRAAVGDLGIIGRIGGDEFVILIPGGCSQSTLTSLCDTILTSITRPTELDSGVYTDVGISIGVALAPGAGNTEADIFAAADAALYKAKNGGRNRVVFHNTTSEMSVTDVA